MPGTRNTAARACAVLAACGALLTAPGAQAAPAAPAADRCSLRGASEGPTDYRAYIRPRGSVDVTVLFVDFSDLPGHGTSTRDLHDSVMPGALRWLRTVSRGKVRLRTDVHHRWVRMPRRSTAYELDDITYESHERYIADAVAAANPRVDFSRTDSVYIFAPPRSPFPVSPTFLGGPGSAVMADGRRIGWGVTFGNDIHGDEPYGSNVAVHETLHTFGLPDLYRYGDGYPQLHHDIGAWDIMGWVGPGFGLTAWHLRKLGWLPAKRMLCLRRGKARTVTLRPVGARKGRQAVVVRLSRSRAWVVESRQRTGVDAGVCSPGVLVYLVDARRESGRSPLRLLPAARTDVEGCGPLADATYGLGAGRSSTARSRIARLRVKVLRDGRRGSRVRVSTRR